MLVVDAVFRKKYYLGLQRMPVVNFHLDESKYSQSQCEELMSKASELYSTVLESPIERIRVFIQFYPKWGMASGGIPVSKGGGISPYFSFVVLEGRPVEQCQALLSGFTSLVVEVLGEERSSIRGLCQTVPPEFWGIGGVSANELRKSEIKKRKNAG
jgi:4-oxalocrotonate tautomerase